MSYKIDEDNGLDELIKETLKNEQENPQPRIIDLQKKKILLKFERAYIKSQKKMEQK